MPRDPITVTVNVVAPPGVCRACTSGQACGCACAACLAALKAAQASPSPIHPPATIAPVGSVPDIPVSVSLTPEQQKMGLRDTRFIKSPWYDSDVD